MEKLFESKELDVDGRLSFEEFMGEQSRAERLFKLMDKDGDGFVTKNVSLGSFFKIYIETQMKHRKQNSL